MALLVAFPASADILPWLSDAAHPLPDPFGTEKKANRLISPALRPATCPEAPDVKRKLRFNDVVIAALCHNPDTRAAYLSLLGQAATYGGSYSAYFPSFSATADRSRSSAYGRNSHTSSIGQSYGVTGSWTLYDFGQREATIETAELALIAAGHSYNSSLQGMIAAAMRSYFQLLTSQNAVVITQESERFAKASFDAASLRHQIGQVPLADKLQAKASYSQTLLASEQALNQLSLDQAAVAQLMGLPADTSIEAAEMDDSDLMRDPFNGEVQALMEEAKQKRTDLLAGRTQVKSSEASLRAQKRANLATVTAGVNADYGDDHINVFGSGATRSRSVGVSVNIPIFTGFNQTYTERALEKSLEAQREQLVRTELDVEQDVWNSWHNYQTAKRSWEVSWDQVATATQLKDVALGRYKEGLGTILDVLNAQSQYSSALQSQLQTRYNLLTTRVDLVRAVGVLDLDSMRPNSAEPLPAPMPAIKDEP